jgi:hypothetical protein
MRFYQVTIQATIPVALLLGLIAQANAQSYQNSPPVGQLICAVRPPPPLQTVTCGTGPGHPGESCRCGPNPYLGRKELVRRF